MERIDGPTMLEALTRQPWTLCRNAAVVASLHTRLPYIPASGPLFQPSRSGSAGTPTCVLLRSPPCSGSWRGSHVDRDIEECVESVRVLAIHLLDEPMPNVLALSGDSRTAS